MSDRLARRYTRLLRFYPPGPRRAEMLGTLLECAPPDRVRPTVKEVVNLTRFGLRARLGRPASTSVVVLSLLVTLVCGLLGAAASARLGWALQEPLPSGAEAERLEATAFPGLTVLGGGDAPPFVPAFGADGGEIYGFAEYWVRNTPETREVLAYTKGVRDRLAGAGWEIRDDISYEEDHEQPSWSAEFSASRDGLILSYSAYYVKDHPWYDSDGSAGFQLSRTTPPWPARFAIPGGLLAACFGWLVFGWASRRSEGHPGRTVGAVALVWPAIVVVAVSLFFISQWYSQPEPLEGDSLWTTLDQLSQGPATLALGLGLLALAVAVLPGRPRVFAAAALVLVTVGAMAGWPGWVRPGCTPSGPPADLPAAEVAMSLVARVYVTADATAEQRNIAEAAIWHVPSVRTMAWSGYVTDQDYRDAYCGGGPIHGASRATLPGFWLLELSSPGAFEGLVVEVSHLPGVAAVRHAAP
ncbi:hypothetical protein GCM10010168_19050 [Actinoplanes ianthinogenes]|uniref:Uncharacterized protein n=1 Tax=Actinoplanes ianthinogenes TaxID=122358 RepID=A0ABM7M7A8_9ACTN|nr:hypothetical protein [Actinoplanes ianthinogenes]BCJ47547.1 hypothetical protein Aiant_82040 [Actinoplanes ianthinogenes]GGR02515.1 hypothetical protein GCM10010168_19050 [Actinoplanes ianthinogenes]